MKYNHFAELTVAKNSEAIINDIVAVIRRRGGKISERSNTAVSGKLGNRIVSRLLGICVLGLFKRQLPTIITVSISEAGENVSLIKIYLKDNLGLIFRDSFAKSEYNKYFIEIVNEISHAATA